ncbi:MAG: hypothetical protein HYX94_07695 [Chloroflexi bacterium]|nr:hypothetical protein [Chloroflexota bacterium]
MTTVTCGRCRGDLADGARNSILADGVGQPVCGECRRTLLAQFAATLAVLGLGVALSSVVVDMPAALFVAFGGGLLVVAGMAYRWERVEASALWARIRVEATPSTLYPLPSTLSHVAIFGALFSAYYVANLACGDWNPLAVGCNGTCKTVMWGSLGSMALLSTAYIMGYRKAVWPMLGVAVVQNYPHCQCENGFYVQALGVQPLCLIVPTLVGLTNLWMMRIGTFKPVGFALILSLLAGAFAVAIAHRLGSEILIGSVG